MMCIVNLPHMTHSGNLSNFHLSWADHINSRHLTRNHNEKHMCGQCMHSFECEAARDDHSTTCDKRLRCSQEELWNCIWKGIFPGEPLPNPCRLSLAEHLSERNFKFW